MNELGDDLLSEFKATNTLTAFFLNQAEKKSIFDPKQIESLIMAHPLFTQLQKTINYSFKNKIHLFQALTHRSFSHEFGRDKLINNEVLEFLGDSILGAVIAISVTSFFKDLNEGQLSKIKSSLVSEGPLAELAEVIELQNVLLVGKGEFLGEGLNRPSNLSSAFEALVAAIYHDGGFNLAQRFIEKTIEVYALRHKKPFISQDRLEIFDAKSRLQELTMKRYKVLPEYRATQNADQSFTVELYINNQLLFSETDISKKRAQKLLAQRALDHLQTEGE